MGRREDLVARIGALDTAVADARAELGKALVERGELVSELGAMGLNERGAPAGAPSPAPVATQAIPAVNPPPSPKGPEVPSNVTAMISPADIAPGLHPMLRRAGTWEPHLVWSGTPEPPRTVQEAICGIRDDPRNWEYHRPSGDRIEVHVGCLERMRGT